MRQRRSPLVIIFITVLIDLIGFGIVIPVLPLYAERFGASPLVIGLLLASYSATQCLFAPILGKLSDRVGRRPVLLLSLIGTSIGFLLMGFAQTLWLLFTARIIDGMTGGNISTAQAYIADVTPPQQRSRGMGLIGAAFGLGFIIGPAIGGLLSRVSPAAPFFFAAALAASNALALYWLLPESVPVEQRARSRHPVAPRPLFSTARERRLIPVFATYFCTTVAFSLLTATYPLFTQRRFGYDATHNGYIFACLGIVSALIQGGLLGWLLKISSDKMLAIAGTLLLMLSLLMLPMSRSVTSLLLMTAGIAIGHGLIAAPLNGLASKRASAELQGRVLGFMQSIASVARIAGPVVGGWLLHYDATALTAPFGRTPYWAGAGVLGFGLLCAMAL